MARPRVQYTTRQPTTGRGRIVRQPARRISMGTLAGMRPTAPRILGQGAVAAPGTIASTAAAPAYSTSNLPPDASYDAQIAGLQRQRDEGLASIQGERFRGLSDYGFTEGPNGTLAMDPNNPFSKAAVMKKTYDTNRRSTAQSLASQGQQYAGSSQNAQDLVNRNELQSQDAMQKTLAAFLARNTGQATQANTGYETAAQQAAADRIARFSSNPLYDPQPDAPPPPQMVGGAVSGGAYTAKGRNPWTSMGVLSRLRRR